MPTPKVIYYPAPERALTREEIQQVFARFAPSDPIMIAVRQIFVERLAIATIDSTEGKLSKREAGKCAGRLEEIAGLQAEFAEFHRAAASLRQQRAVEPPAKPTKKSP